MTRESGFSLVEVLMALGLTAMIGLAGTLLLQQTLRAGRTAETHAESQASLITGHRLLTEDLANATPRRARDAAGLGPSRGFYAEDGFDGPRFGFVRAGWSNPGLRAARGDLMRVEYALVENQLIRRAWLAADPADHTPVAERIIADQVTSARLRYRAGEAWYESWPPERATLPELIELQLVFADADVLTQVFLVGSGR
jgi:general secretion pathway protein J